MNGGPHPRADMDRIYVQRTLGGRGLLGVEDTVSFGHAALYYYLKDHTDVLMKKVLSSGFVKTPADMSIAPDAFKDHLNVTRFQNGRDKPLHGQYVWNLQDINCFDSFGWLVHSDLKIETGSLILAAQDQALNTKYFNASILGGSDPLCNLCGTNNETVAHIVSGCSTLVETSYKKCHDAVRCHLHCCLCLQFGFPVVKEWWKHNPKSVEESESVKLLWDFTITTNRTIHPNRPDLILVLKEERRTYLIDFSRPFDNNVTCKEAEKVEKYQDLLLEIQRLWHVRAEIIPIVIGALGAVSPKFDDWLKSLHINLYPCTLQKSALLETAGLLRRTLNIHL